MEGKKNNDVEKCITHHLEEEKKQTKKAIKKRGGERPPRKKIDGECGDTDIIVYIHLQSTMLYMNLTTHIRTNEDYTCTITDIIKQWW